MSGGVDSAVALLRAGPDAVGRDLAALARPGRPGLGARLLLAGRGDRRARDVPRARAAARHARSARRVPPGRRRAVRARLRARRDAESLRPLQRQLPLRRAARLRATEPARARSGPAITRASSSATAFACSPAPPTRRRTSRTCSLRSIRACSTGSSSRSASRRRRRRAPRRPTRRARGRRARARARRRASSPATTTALSSAGRASTQRTGSIVDEDGEEVGPPRRLLALHAGSAARAPGRRRRAALRAPDRRRDEHGRGRAARGARLQRRPRRAAGSTSRSIASRQSCATARPRVPAKVHPATRLPARARRSPPTPSRPARWSRSTPRTPSSGLVWCRPRDATRIVWMPLLAVTAGDVAYYALAFFLVAVGRRARLHVLPARRDVRAPLLVHPGNRARPAAGDHQGRRQRRQGERPARQG